MTPHATANHKLAVIVSPLFLSIQHTNHTQKTSAFRVGTGGQPTCELQNLDISTRAASTNGTPDWSGIKKADARSAFCLNTYCASAAKALSRICSTGPTPAMRRYFGAPGSPVSAQL